MVFGYRIHTEAQSVHSFNPHTLDVISSDLRSRLDAIKRKLDEKVVKFRSIIAKTDAKSLHFLLPVPPRAEVQVSVQTVGQHGSLFE